MSEHGKNKPKQRSRHRGRVGRKKANEKRILQKKTQQAGGNKKRERENWGTTGPYFTLRGAIRLMDERGEGKERLL